MSYLLPISFNGGILTRNISHLVKMSFQGGEQRSFHQRRLSRTTHTRNDGHHVQRKLNVDASQIVHATTLEFYIHIPRSSRRRNINLIYTQQILDSIRTRILLFHTNQLLLTWDFAFEYDFTSQSTSIRSHVNQVICCTHDFLIVFHHDNGIAKRLQILENVNQSLRITTMQTDTGFIENVKRTYQRTTKRRSEINALAFATTQRIGRSV